MNKPKDISFWTTYPTDADFRRICEEKKFIFPPGIEGFLKLTLSDVPSFYLARLRQNHDEPYIASYVFGSERGYILCDLRTIPAPEGERLQCYEFLRPVELNEIFDSIEEFMPVFRAALEMHLRLDSRPVTVVLHNFGE